MSNPIIQRELIGFLRTRKALASMVGLSAALATLVLLRWPADARVAQSGLQAQQVFRLFGYGLLAGVVLLAPVFPAAGIVRERRSGTLALLLNTPLTRFDILVGKLCGAAGFVMLLLVNSLPAAAACYAMGGISFTGQLLAAYAVLFMAAAEYATLALWISARAATIDGALRLTYAGVLALTLLPLGPYAFLHGTAGGVLATAVDYLRCLSPLPAMMAVMGQGGLTAGGTVGLGHVALRFVIMAALLAAAFAGLALHGLSRRMFDRPRAAGRVTDEQSARVQAYRRIMYLWFFDPQRRSGLMGDRTNPVMVKEFRTSRFGRSHWMMRLVGACFVVSLGLMLVATRNSQWGVDKLGGIMVLLQMALIVFIAPALAAGLISSERETGGWNQLKMTPLSAATIVGGKLLAVGRTLALLVVATLPGYLVILAFDTLGHAGHVPDVLLTLLLTMICAVLVSAALSSMLARTSAATAAAYAVLLVLCVGTMFFWLGRDAPFAPRTVEVALTANPLAAALSAMNAPGFGAYHLLPANWVFLGALSAAALAVLLLRTWQLTRPT